MVYLLELDQLKEKKLSFYSYIIKDRKLLQKYVYIYNTSITKDMIIQHKFRIGKLEYYLRKGLKKTYLHTPQTHTQSKYQDVQRKWLHIFPYNNGHTEWF